MFLRTWSRSWEFAKLSYGTLLENKHLIVFPIISAIALALVLASFFVPLETTGKLNSWISSEEAQNGTQQDPVMYITAFLYYFCNYFIIVFFNTALIACVMDIFEGGKGKLGFGLKFAASRIHAIFGWSLVSACVGMILNALERNDKIGRFVSGLLGSAWSALTYFVIPIIVADGVGPIAAVKQSMRTLKETWGTALMGNFSMGGIAFLIMLPIIAIGFVLGIYVSLTLALAVCIPLAILAALISSTADAIFKACLFSYATGKGLPANIDTTAMREAFTPRQ